MYLFSYFFNVLYCLFPELSSAAVTTPCIALATIADVITTAKNFLFIFFSCLGCILKLSAGA